MLTNRSFYLLFVMVALVFTACAPRTAIAPNAEPVGNLALPFARTACAEGVDLTGQTVSIYHILALVGEQSDTFLQPLKAGFDDATEYFNAHGGVCGASLAQVFADTEISPQEIYDRITALESKPLLVTLYGSGDAEELGDQLAKDEIPGLGIRVGSIQALYGQNGQTPGWVFGTNPLYVEQVGSMCDYIAANPDLFPQPVLGFISWDEGWARSSDTDESRAYCKSVGVDYAGASYFSIDSTYIQPQVQNLINAGANVLYTNSLENGPVLVARTLDEMGLQGKVTLAAVNWAMDPTVGLLGEKNIRHDGLPAMSGMIGSLPLRSWAEMDHPGIQLMIEQADLHQRPQQVRNHYYTLAWASTDLYIEVYIQTGNRVGFDHITGADIKATLENIVYSPLGGVETIDFKGGARRTLSANRIGQMNYLGQDGKNMVPMLVPLTDFQTAPDLRPAGADVPATNLIEPTNTSEPSSTQTVLGVFDGTIAFRSDRTGNDEIYMIKGDGSGLFNLTNHSSDDDLPAWSPDGTLIAFCSLRDGDWEIYVMNADGSNQARLTDKPGEDCAPSWSPDGTQIIFISNRDDNPEIYVMNADGSNQTRLTDNPAFDVFPSWSPNGKQIVFVSDRDGQANIYVMSADGSGITLLTSMGADWVFFPDWSPDGRKIAFNAVSDSNDEIYVMNADGSGLTPLTDNPANDWFPRWSPDGTQITFSSERDGNAEIYLMNADGSGQIRLTDNSAGDELPVWQP